MTNRRRRRLGEERRDDCYNSYNKHIHSHSWKQKRGGDKTLWTRWTCKRLFADFNCKKRTTLGSRSCKNWSGGIRSAAWNSRVEWDKLTRYFFKKHQPAGKINWKVIPRLSKENSYWPILTSPSGCLRLFRLRDLPQISSGSAARKRKEKKKPSSYKQPYLWPPSAACTEEETTIKRE